MFSFAVFISGNGSNLQAIINATNNGQIDGKICCVLSNKEEAFGLVRAKEANIPTIVIKHQNFETREKFENAILKSLKSFQIDLIVLAGFMRILSPVLIKPYLGKLMNIHPSLLPKYPGLNTHQKVIDNQDNQHGVTIHFVDETLDGGQICAQSIIKVESNDINILENKIHELEHELYPKVIQRFAEGELKLIKGKQ
ncbi:MAG TPA: phosphoribosylglycinamide formyltransferase [Gammaproteobacteria bacterium]|jgi:phosphoribosylglycinamide formyltransferase-1|nr:phosphoribosylglycinamide formyltransferase [Gammaproteobacteria bacterium]HIK72430.1 phosphoribosylglycinamide formyltransferase [Gammaproteobacteria bacterium]